MGCWFAAFVIILWMVGVLTAPEMIRIYIHIALFIVAAFLLWAAFCYVVFRLPRERKRRRERDKAERRP